MRHSRVRHELEQKATDEEHGDEERHKKMVTEREKQLNCKTQNGKLEIREKQQARRRDAEPQNLAAANLFSMQQRMERAVLAKQRQARGAL